MIRRLLQPDMYSGRGIRTLSKNNPAYDPNAYQLGSVWPHDNAIIAAGAKRYGLWKEANTIARGIFDAAEKFQMFRLPELFAGQDREEEGFPVQYLGANIPQAWAAGSIFMLLRAILGIEPDAHKNLLHLDPTLPDWLPDLTITGLRVGHQQLAIRFTGEDAASAMRFSKAGTHLPSREEADMKNGSEHRVVVVTGASAGVGRATVRAFAKRGCSVGLIARGSEGLDAAAAEVRGEGARAVAVSADVADAEALDRAADQIERELGPIDVWVNVAMTTVYAPFAEITPAEYKRATEVTYLGYVYGTMAALRRMRPRNRGSHRASGLGPVLSRHPAASPVLRREIWRSEVLRTRCARNCSMTARGIHITMVQMPALNTPQFNWGRNKLPMRPQPVPPIYQPEVAADAIVFASIGEVAGGLGRGLDVQGHTRKQDGPVAPRPLSRQLRLRVANVVGAGSEGYAWTTSSSRIEGDFGAHGRFDCEALATAGMRSPVLSGFAITGGALFGLLFLAMRG